MSAVKEKAVANYKALISKTDSEIASEQLELRVEQADLNFQQGLLSLKSKMISAEGDVKQAESVVKTREKSLESAKASQPENLVQNIVDAKIALKQAELDLVVVKESYADLKTLYDYLEGLKKELFS